MIPRSTTLLRSVLDEGEYDADDLATELGVARPEIDGYLGGNRVMPLSRQLALAKFVVATSNKLRRQGYALHGQVLAATSFNSKKTPTHSGPPPRWNDPRRRP